MRFIMSTPAGWTDLDRDGARVLLRGDVAAPTAIAEISPLASVPEDTRTWAERTLGDATIVRVDEVTGRDGWRAQLVTAEAASQHQLGAYVHFLDDLGACVIVRAASAEELAAAAQEILACFVEGRPGWRCDGEVIAISDLFVEAEPR